MEISWEDRKLRGGSPGNRLQKPYDLGQSLPFLPQNSLLFEQSPLNETLLLSTPTSPYHSEFSHSSTPTNTAYPFFEPFSEPPPPNPVNSCLKSPPSMICHPISTSALAL
ncbi:hypothetical protein JOM56_001752 [Amanita muscaria]